MVLSSSQARLSLAYIPHILDLGASGNSNSSAKSSHHHQSNSSTWLYWTSFPYLRNDWKWEPWKETSIWGKQFLDPHLILPSQFPFEISPLARNFNIFFKTFLWDFDGWNCKGRHLGKQNKYLKSELKLWRNKISAE